MAATRSSLFRLAALIALGAAAFHALALASPDVARLEYPPSYPALRHVVFIAIDVALAALLVRRPRWLIWPYLLLTAHVLNGHGRAVWTLWTGQHHVEWISLLVSVAMLLGLWLIVLDRRG